MTEHAAAEARPPGAAAYIVVWVLLLCLTGLTLGLSRIDMGAWNLVVALAIAVVKSALVALFFMHLLHETANNRMVLIVAALFLALLATLAVVDVMTRFPLADPPESVRARMSIEGQLD